MPKPKKAKVDVLDIEPIVPLVEAPKVETPVVVEPTVVGTKPSEQRPTGKFEKLLHEGRYFLVNTDGRILSSGDTEDTVDRMVMSLNNKRR